MRSGSDSSHVSSRRCRGYASLAVGLLIVGAQRQREFERALRTSAMYPLRFRIVGLFLVGGVALAVVTVVLVITQT